MKAMIRINSNIFSYFLLTKLMFDVILIMRTEVQHSDHASGDL
jgi:hypothetical protein